MSKPRPLLHEMLISAAPTIARELLAAWRGWKRREHEAEIRAREAAPKGRRR